eukprot:Skav232876  [mRNA]  locus=scaffold1432:52751:55468:- [translate_table: standard]
MATDGLGRDGWKAVVERLDARVEYGVRHILGITAGYNGLSDPVSHPPLELTEKMVRDIHMKGGSIIKAARCSEWLGLVWLIVNRPHAEFVSQVIAAKQLYGQALEEVQLQQVMDSLPGAAIAMTLMIGHVVCTAESTGDYALPPCVPQKCMYEGLRSVAPVKQLPLQRVEKTTVMLADYLRAIRISSPVCQAEAAVQFTDRVDMLVTKVPNVSVSTNLRCSHARLEGPVTHPMID